jgi:biotin transporter BioY
MFIYLIEGACGLPFFSNGGSGILTFLGPTGGYLVSFPAAAFITGSFAEHGWDKRFFTAAAAMTIGSAMILVSGWAWLCQLMPPLVAYKAGIEPFIIGDIVKIILAAAVLPSGWYFLDRKASNAT